jgi:hypothetical protein
VIGESLTTFFTTLKRPIPELACRGCYRGDHFNSTGWARGLTWGDGGGVGWGSKIQRWSGRMRSIDSTSLRSRRMLTNISPLVPSAQESKTNPLESVRRADSAIKATRAWKTAAIDAEVVVNRGEEVAGVAGALDHVFAAFVAGADDAAGLDAATGPDVGEGARPVIAARLQRAGGPLASPAPVLRSKLIFGVRPNSPVTTTSTRLSSPRA